MRCVLREVITALCRRGTARSGTSSTVKRQRSSYIIQSCLDERFAFMAAVSGERVLSRSTATKYYETRWHSIHFGKRTTFRFLWPFSLESPCADLVLSSVCASVGFSCFPHPHPPNTPAH